MKMRRWAAAFVLVTVLGCSAVAAKDKEKAKSPAASLAAGGDFRALMVKVLDAWSTMDPANAAPFYAQEGDRVYYDVAPMKYTGWAEYADGAKKLLEGFSSLKFTLGDDAWTHRQGNLAWGTATWSADAATKGGAKVVFKGRWTVIWEKRGSEWLITHEHVSVPMPPMPTGKQSLYTRLGGYDALAAVTDDFIGRLAGDPTLGKFFAGHSTASLKHIRQLVVDQLCEATGGPCVYIGRDMKTAHAGLGITEEDWNNSVKHLVATLDKFQVPAQEKDEVLAAISGLKKDIVSPPAGGAN